MKRMKIIAQGILFILIIALGLGIYYRIITPKYFTDQIYSTTTTYRGFYDMETDSTEVLFLGPSKGACAFLPQELYNGYGIRSYNLSCENQSLLTSYYWLREALKTQKPRAVVLECSMLFEDFKEGPLVAPPDLTRKAFDWMHWSPVKAEAVRDICAIDSEQTALSYIFPNIRYHERRDISKKDFSLRKMSSWSELKGYSFIPLRGGYEFGGYDLDTDGGSEDGSDEVMNPLMEEYLSRITGLCKDEGIELVLVFTPSVKNDKANCHALAAYAADNGLRLIDFNDKKVFEEAGYDFALMNSDKVHSNMTGAVCITDYVGKVLSAEYAIPAVKDEQWESTREFYEFTLTQANLIYMEDAGRYLDAIADKRYDVAEFKDGAKTEYDVREKRTGRLIDIGIIEEGADGKGLLTHVEVDIN